MLWDLGFRRITAEPLSRTQAGCQRKSSRIPGSQVSLKNPEVALFWGPCTNIKQAQITLQKMECVGKLPHVLEAFCVEKKTVTKLESAVRSFLPKLAQTHTSDAGHDLITRNAQPLNTLNSRPPGPIPNMNVKLRFSHWLAQL